MIVLHFKTPNSSWISVKVFRVAGTPTEAPPMAASKNFIGLPFLSIKIFYDKNFSTVLPAGNISKLIFVCKSCKLCLCVTGGQKIFSGLWKLHHWQSKNIFTTSLGAKNNFTKYLRCFENRRILPLLQEHTFVTIVVLYRMRKNCFW